MDLNPRWSSSYWETSNYHGPRHYGEPYEGQFPSPSPPSVHGSDHWNYLDSWNDDHLSPSPQDSQRASNVRVDHSSASVLSTSRYLDGHAHTGVQAFRSPARPFGGGLSRQETHSGRVPESYGMSSQGMLRLDHIDPAHYSAQEFPPASSDKASLQRDVPRNQEITRNAFGWKLRPVSELPDRFRGVFKFGVFNAIQSACLDQILHSQENIVISAPTGSGKTVIFELGMIRMLTQTANDTRSSKCVYVAPTKALCKEKHNEWTAKFGGLGVKCCELTGDTLLSGKGVWGDAKSSHIIVTTAEKWDSLTRNWADHSGILSQIKLFLVDEVHVLNDSRGSTLEVVISRMKARGSGTRFLLVSATVPNVEDIACWIGSSDNCTQPAKIFKFGEEFRPCKLTKFVYGVPKPNGQNDFVYARTLDLRLFSVLQRHSTNRPILIFCPTRKGTVDTAKQLAKEFQQTLKAKGALPWSSPTRIDRKFRDKDLTALATMGVAVHHAGLDVEDRKAVEELYLQKILRVLVATSTLAVGVNLPAQMVVIKGVKLYHNGEMREYSDLDIMQMMGRAGRPQFDDEGIAIVLCELELEHKYRALAQGSTILESTLHQNLVEHLNSEIGLGTISTIENAKDWLRRSFLFRRIQKNPEHYDVGKDENQTWEEKVDEIVLQSIQMLRDTQLITYSERDGKVCSTEYGDVMSKFYIRQATMRATLNLPSTATMRDILELISTSEELADLRLRNGEKAMYEKIRCHQDIRFPPKKMAGTSEKILLLIQAILAGLPLNSPEFRSSEGQPYLEAVSIFRHATRIVTGVAEVAIINRNGAQLKHALELVRCLNAKSWEDRPLVLRQIEHIGEKSKGSVKQQQPKQDSRVNEVLAENGINSIQKLLQTTPFRIEELLNRRPPFGFEVLAAAVEFPKYFLDVREIRTTHGDGKMPVEVDFSVQCGLVIDSSAPQRVKKSKWSKTEMTTLLIVTSDLQFVDFRRTATKALRDKKEFVITAQLTKPSQVINVYIASDKFAGVTVSRTLVPSVAPNNFPTLETRPLTSIEMDLEGLEDIPDFWDIDLDADDNGMQVPHVVDLTTGRSKGAGWKAGDKNQPATNVPTTQPDGPEPRKRPDGKYECNHPCKDKLKCRHYCCHEGLLDPPRTTKKKQLLDARDLDAKPNNPPRNATEQKRRNPILSKPDKLYEDSNSSSSQVHLGDRQGLKIVDGSMKSRLNKMTPNFDLQLTTLKRPRSPTPGCNEVDDTYNELPSISEMLEVETTSSKTKNTILADEKVLENPPSKRTRRDESAPLFDSSPHEKSTTLSSIRSLSPQPYKKRLFLPSSNDDTADRCHDSYPTSRALTPYSASPYRESHGDVIRNRFVDAEIDRSMFGQRSKDDASAHRAFLGDTLDAATPHGTPTVSAMKRKGSYTLSPSRISGFIRRSNAQDRPIDMHHGHDFAPTHPARSHTPVGSSNHHDTLDDPLADFEEWLASGAVEIIDHL